MEKNSHLMNADILVGKEDDEQLLVPFYKDTLAGDETGFAEIMNGLPRYDILNNSWPQYATLCKAAFSMMYTAKALVLKFYVDNDSFGSVERPINGPVHLDNCVEFFVSFNNEASYYNIEYNCLGIGKIAYGSSNKNRKFLQEASVKRINTWTTMTNKQGIFNWEMTLLIPAEVFEFSNISLNHELVCRANFYKCGDNLPEPHFMSWKKIIAEHPNFHRPEFFGKIAFSDDAEAILDRDTGGVAFYLQ